MAITTTSTQDCTRVLPATMSEPIIDLTDSSPPPIEQARTPTAKALLQSAIDSAEPARLRETLLALCNSSAEAACIVSSFLLVPEDLVQRRRHRKAKSEEDSDKDEDDSEEDSEEDSDENSSDSEDEGEAENGAQRTGATPNSLKRLRLRYAKCENCNEEFDVTDNDKGACVYHDGRLILERRCR